MITHYEAFKKRRAINEQMKYKKRKEKIQCLEVISRKWKVIGVLWDEIIDKEKRKFKIN